MRSHPKLTAFKVIVVTDRTQLKTSCRRPWLTGESTTTITRSRNSNPPWPSPVKACTSR